MSNDDIHLNMKTEFGFWASTIKKWFDCGLEKIKNDPEVLKVDSPISNLVADENLNFELKVELK